ncbi:MAG: hypothetical protein HC782_03955 [Gammaproteobacteria bacterium]|nr:hypothetical protein [Gammaproteobacteria bacterium]
MTTQELNPLSASPQNTALPAHAKLLYRVLNNLEYGSLAFTSPEGVTKTFNGKHDGPHADIRFQDWGVAREVIKSAEIGLAECYRDGRLFSANLTAFLELCAVNAQALEKIFYGNPLVALFFRLKHFCAATHGAVQRKYFSTLRFINDFYQLWLDETMTYSSALFDGNHALTLESAQTAKYERILRELKPLPGETILEIGCGWGWFAEYAVKTRGVKIDGITLSTEQLNLRSAHRTAWHVGQRKLCAY